MFDLKLNVQAEDDLLTLLKTHYEQQAFIPTNIDGAVFS